RRALQLDELFRGDRRVPITEISYPNWLFGLALEVLDRQRLMPRPDLRSHEGIGGLHDRRFLAEARHDRVETVRASIELAETLRFGSERVERIGGDGLGQSIVCRAHEDTGRIREIRRPGKIRHGIRPPVDRAAGLAWKRRARSGIRHSWRIVAAVVVYIHFHGEGELFHVSNTGDSAGFFFCPR